MVAKKYLLLLSFVQFLFAAQSDSTLTLTKNDFLEFKIGSYINGFNEFDHSIIVGDKMVSIGIYFDNAKQNEFKARELKKRFETQIPKILEKYSWTKDYVLLVSVYGEKREQ